MRFGKTRTLVFLALALPLLFFSACPPDNSGPTTTYFTVTFDKNTDKAVSGLPPSQKVAQGGMVIEPDAPDAAGNRFPFQGWFKEGATANAWVFTSDTVTANTTLYAKWGSEPMSEKTAWNYFQDEGILAGWNVGNTLDSHNSVTGGETGWGNPQINQVLLNGVKAAGYDMVRVPVTYMAQIGDAPDYIIAPARLNRVQQVVDMCYEAGLKVMINIHHDGHGTDAQNAAWLAIAKSNTDKVNYIDKYKKVWTQIAERFKDYGDFLFFEAFNELHQNWNLPGGQQGDTYKAVINELNQEFTNVVRATGSNNAKRYLVHKGYQAHEDYTYQYLILPTDPSPNRQIVSFHYYKPNTVGLGQGSTVNTTWGSQNDKDTMDQVFEHYKTTYTSNQIPVLIGECGATRRKYNENPNATEQAHTSRLAYLTHLYATGKKYNLVPIYWDNGRFDTIGDITQEYFGLFARYWLEGEGGLPYGLFEIPVTYEFAECIEAMIKAVKPNYQFPWRQ